jgi:alpha-beta hydrolase superfamily lysophospholipase
MAVHLTRRELVRGLVAGSAAMGLASACGTPDAVRTTRRESREPVRLTTEVSLDADGNRVGVLMADTTPRDGTAPLAVYCHGHGGGALAGFDPVNTGQRHNVVGLARAGYIVVSSDMKGPASWGNDAAQASIDSAIAHGQTRYRARTGQVLMIGTSMGGAAALAFTARYPAKVAGCIAIIPILDLDTARTNGLPDVDRAYSGGYSVARYGLDHNPMTQAAAGKFAGMPLQVWYADKDMYMSVATSAGFVAAVRAGADPRIDATQLDGTHSEETTATIPRATLVGFARSVLPPDA